MSVGYGARAIAVATKGKGVHDVVRRARDLRHRYGICTFRMADRLTTVLDLVAPYGYSATLPVPAIVVARYPHVISRYSILGIEFAVHGFYHVDHTRLTDTEQLAHLYRARRLLESNGITASGFRAPYLRWNEATLRALRESAFTYDGSQAFSWPLEHGSETSSYRRALSFVSALSAEDHAIVPWIDRGLVRMPYVLPDDESLVDRLGFDAKAIEQTWLDVFRQTHERGELFTLAVHPERIDYCAAGVRAVLDEARRHASVVWIARHDEIAQWWLQRASANVVVTDDAPERLRITVEGPDGATILVRGLALPGAEPAFGAYSRIPGDAIELCCDRRPFVGVHPSAPASVVQFVKEQGFIVEISDSPNRYSVFLHPQRFEIADRRSLLAEIERGDTPLVRLGRWPGGARSALSITGDVDALTLRDYAFRLVGR